MAVSHCFCDDSRKTRPKNVFHRHFFPQNSPSSSRPIREPSGVNELVVACRVAFWLFLSFPPKIYCASNVFSSSQSVHERPKSRQSPPSFQSIIIDSTVSVITHAHLCISCLPPPFLPWAANSVSSLMKHLRRPLNGKSINWPLRWTGFARPWSRPSSN